MRIGRFSTADIWCSWLFVYFSSKMLWDTVPYIFELLSLGLIAFYTLKFILSRDGFPVHTVKLIITFLAFSFYIIVDGVLQCSTQQFVRAIYEYIFYIFMFFAMAYLLPRANICRCLKVVAVWGVIIACLSWVEFISKSYIISNIVYDPTKPFRATVFTRSFLSHGVILGIFSVVCMHFFYTDKRLGWLLPAALCFVSILTTNSRGPLVAFGLALVLQFMLNSYISQKHSLKRFGASVLLAAAAVVVLIVVFGTFETSNEVINAFLRRIRSIIDWSGDAGNLGRLLYWEQAIEWFQTNILFGIGPSKTGSWGAGSIGVTESGVLKRLCELGLVGFLIYYCFVAQILIRGIGKYVKQSDDNKRALTLWFSLALAMLINDCTLQSTEEIMISFFLWTAFAGIETAGVSDAAGLYEV